MSPILFREYGNDIPACMTLEYQRWVEGEIEDIAAFLSETREGEDVSSITTKVDKKKDSERSEDEKWDAYLRSTVNDIDSWRLEKMGIGPEPELILSENIGSEEGSIFTDDNSAGEEAHTVS